MIQKFAQVDKNLPNVKNRNKGHKGSVGNVARTCQKTENQFSPVPEDLNLEELSEDTKLEFLFFNALFSNAQ